MGTDSELKVSVPKHWTPPKAFDEYRLLWPLGRGGMGAVYLGHDMLLDRAIAVKFISSLNPDAVSREQFLTEARAAARLQHPNVVTVYRVGEIDGRPYIIQEYLRGESLERMKKPLPWQQVLDLAIGLSRGLAAAHRRGVLHRDLKPGNVMLPTEGGVKLLDFGLAKLVDANRSQAIDVAGLVDAEKGLSGEQRAVTQSVDLLAATMAGTSTPNQRGKAGGDPAKIAAEAGAAVISLSGQKTPQAKPRANPIPPPDPSDSLIDPSKLRLAAQNRLAAAFGKEHTAEEIPDELWRADPLERSSTI
ncbi:MAG TPA: serine/threonine-protein kinase, partial [Pseudomonadota bacterium]|nr:serine/threonine-protein kinase [Pseudomonadota bacterium]